MSAIESFPKSTEPSGQLASLSDISLPSKPVRFTSIDEAVKWLRSVIEERRGALVNEFGIEVLGEGRVKVALNGASRIEFLLKVQEIVSALYGLNGLHERRETYVACLKRWANEQAFTDKTSKELEIAVDGNVANSSNMSREDQNTRGWNNVDLCDLAVAHAAYFLATGKDLFNGYIVRARVGALSFDDLGLNVLDRSGNYRNRNTAASAALPSRN